MQVLLHDGKQRSPAVNVNEVLYQVTVVVIDYRADSRRIATLPFVMQTDDIAQRKASLRHTQSKNVLCMHTYTCAHVVHPCRVPYEIIHNISSVHAFTRGCYA